MSQLGRHQSALEHAQNALILLQEELLTPPGSSGSAAPPQADRIAVLAIAYHNIGVEQEFLKRYDQSIISYRKGVEVAERYLGAKHAICITLKNSLVAAKKVAASSGGKSGKAAAKEESKGNSLGAKATSKNTTINNSTKKNNTGVVMNASTKASVSANSTSDSDRKEHFDQDGDLDIPEDNEDL